jgi:hypothetical protein
MLAWDGSGNAVQTNGTNADNTSGTMYAIGDLLTWSAGTYATTTGLLVRIASGDMATSRAVARIENLQLGSIKSNTVQNSTLAFISAL